MRCASAPSEFRKKMIGFTIRAKSANGYRRCWFGIAKRGVKSEVEMWNRGERTRGRVLCGVRCWTVVCVVFLWCVIKPKQYRWQLFFKKKHTYQTHNFIFLNTKISIWNTLPKHFSLYEYYKYVFLTTLFKPHFHIILNNITQTPLPNKPLVFTTCL